ncbi:hypothetical protein [Spirosoma endophyticum]|uniref:hypothetical protein n=1 Tax=Spirosoma endophyticum TaxID=662367 RepID=UPI00116047B7|nr:hypothetical protein [Spirosoma endophyticum]
MRNIAWFLVFMLVGCRQKDPVLSVNANQLIGTWTTPSISANERPFTRWTFKPDFVYTSADTLQTCQPVDNSHYYRYRIENGRLIGRFEGYTTGLYPIPEINRRILSITASEMMLDAPRQVFKKCP